MIVLNILLLLLSTLTVIIHLLSMLHLGQQFTCNFTLYQLCPLEAQPPDSSRLLWCPAPLLHSNSPSPMSFAPWLTCNHQVEVNYQVKACPQLNPQWMVVRIYRHMIYQLQPRYFLIESTWHIPVQHEA